jgi:hypothetical protein
METLLSILAFLLVIALLVGIYMVRTAWMQRAAEAAGLDFLAAPSLEQREDWRALARGVQGLEPTTWGHALRGRVDGAELALQEQELKTSVSSNRVWHTLVVWTLPDARLPAFTLDRAHNGRGWLRDSVAPLVDPAVRALGGDPVPPIPRTPDEIARDTDFSQRFVLEGPDPPALQAHFGADRRAALRRWDPSGRIGGEARTLVWLRPGRAGPTQLEDVLRDARALRRRCAEG